MRSLSCRFDILLLSIGLSQGCKRLVHNCSIDPTESCFGMFLIAVRNFRRLLFLFEAAEENNYIHPLQCIAPNRPIGSYFGMFLFVFLHSRMLLTLFAQLRMLLGLCKI